MNNVKVSGGSAVFVLGVILVVWVAAIVGWVSNIVKIFGLDFSSDVTTEVVLRIVGVVMAPLGVVMGYL